MAIAQVHAWDAAQLFNFNINLAPAMNMHFTCVGHLTRKVQNRCSNTIANNNRYVAVKILRKLPNSKICTNGAQLRQTLTDLAKLSLCKQSHQGQAEEVVENWYDLVVEEVERGGGHVNVDTSAATLLPTPTPAYDSSQQQQSRIHQQLQPTPIQQPLQLLQQQPQYTPPQSRRQQQCIPPQPLQQQQYIPPQPFQQQQFLPHQSQQQQAALPPPYQQYVAWQPTLQQQYLPYQILPQGQYPPCQPSLQQQYPPLQPTLQQQYPPCQQSPQSQQQAARPQTPDNVHEELTRLRRENEILQCERAGQAGVPSRGELGGRFANVRSKTEPQDGSVQRGVLTSTSEAAHRLAKVQRQEELRRQDEGRRETKLRRQKEARQERFGRKEEKCRQEELQREEEARQQEQEERLRKEARRREEAQRQEEEQCQRQQVHHHQAENEYLREGISDTLQMVDRFQAVLLNEREHLREDARRSGTTARLQEQDQSETPRKKASRERDERAARRRVNKEKQS